MSKSDPIPPMSEETKQFIRALNRLAVIYETTPDLPLPYISFNAFVNTREEMAKATKRLAKWKPTKNADGSYYEVAVELAAGHKLTINVPRQEVCERVKVGTKIVEVPAQPAVEAHVKEEPVYEWKCPDAILSPTPTKGPVAVPASISDDGIPF